MFPAHILHLFFVVNSILHFYGVIMARFNFMRFSVLLLCVPYHLYDPVTVPNSELRWAPHRLAL